MIYYVGENRLIDSDEFEQVELMKCLEWLNTHKVFAIDTETEGFFDFSNKILTLQIGDYDTQFVINVQAVGLKRLSYLKPYFESKAWTKLFWNAKFDIKFLKWELGWELEGIYDGFLAECILTTGLENRQLSLGAAAMKYCNVRLDKEVRGQINRVGLTDRVIKYAAEDVRYLHKIQSIQMERITKLDLDRVMDLENEVCIVFADIELNGMKLDKDKWLEVAKQTEQNTNEQEKKLDAILQGEERLKRFVPSTIQGNLFGYEERLIQTNWASPKQTLEIVRALGIKTDSTEEQFLLKHKKTHPLIAELMQFKKQDKLVKSFGRSFLKFVNPVTGRVHPDIWQILNTGRVSFSEPNLQQIPSKGDLGKAMRAAFVEDDEYTIVGGDYSGCELRIIAEGSKDPLWINTFNDGGDLHSIICAKLFDIDIKDVKKPFPLKPDSTYRDVIKTINFGLAYGMSEFKLANTLDIAVDKAKKIIDDYFAIVPNVKRFLELLGNYGKTYGLIKTYAPYRRIRWFEKWSPALNEEIFEESRVLGEIERASKNTPIQGANADLTKQALIDVYKYIKQNELPIKIIITVHDEIRTRCPKYLAESWASTMGRIMTDAGKTIVKSVPMKVDCTITDCWSK